MLCLGVAMTASSSSPGCNLHVTRGGTVEDQPGSSCLSHLVPCSFPRCSASQTTRGRGALPWSLPSSNAAAIASSSVNLCGLLLNPCEPRCPVKSGICASGFLFGSSFEAPLNVAGGKLLLVQPGLQRLRGSWTVPSPKRPQPGFGLSLRLPQEGCQSWLDDRTGGRIRPPLANYNG